MGKEGVPEPAQAERSVRYIGAKPVLGIISILESVSLAMLIMVYRKQCIVQMGSEQLTDVICIDVRGIRNGPNPVYDIYSSTNSLLRYSSPLIRSKYPRTFDTKVSVSYPKYLYAALPGKLRPKRVTQMPASA